ncbi:type II restriction endonuclease [Radicibacter daui]|uniref:type II restriction endonuclease n=1 Tax=Radicibacter daui TaxID=3064829 RepID=UPI0040469C72
MIGQGEFRFEEPGADADLLRALLEKSDQVLVKKLSNNDRNWSKQKEDENGLPVPGKRQNNQAGIYIPKEQRDSGFFPPLAAKQREQADAGQIYEVFIETVWPQSGPGLRQSRLVNYRSKGEETHLTRVPGSCFIDLLPASLLIMGRVRGGNEPLYECLTIDSGSPENDLVEETFALHADFLVGTFEPESVRAGEREKILSFAEQVIAAWLAGTIESFAKSHAAMPATIDLARLAQQAFLKKHSPAAIDPFALERPGDVLREISRDIEWDIFREFQRRERAVALVRIVLGDAPKKLSLADVIRALVDEFPQIDALLLSASQQRKSRAGYSYEHHIEAMLKGGNIPFEKQVIIEAKKRPDFILPSLGFIDSGREDAKSGMILSAKTTLRERWKQVQREMGNRRLFLTTVDENIAGNAIDDMASLGVSLVVPERLLESRETEYRGHSNVMSFRTFCDTQITPHLASWTS